MKPRHLIWLRLIAGFLAAAGGIGVVHELVVEGIDSLVDGAFKACALYGLYLFAVFAARGRLPNALGDRKV